MHLKIVLLSEQKQIGDVNICVLRGLYLQVSDTWHAVVSFSCVDIQQLVWQIIGQDRDPYIDRETYRDKRYTSAL